MGPLTRRRETEQARRNSGTSKDLRVWGRLSEVVIDGFKSIREADLRLRPLNILIGPNGAGKSNFIALFETLNEMLEGRFEVFVERHGKANAFLHFGRKVTPEIKIQLRSGPNAYRLAWVPTVDDRLVFREEAVKLGPSFPGDSERPLGSGHRECRLAEVLKWKPREQGELILRSVRSWMGKVHHLNDTSESALIKMTGDINDNEYLRADGSNLAAFLLRLQQTARPHYDKIRDVVRLVAPFFDDFHLRPLPRNPNKIQLEWRERGSDYPFLAYQLSDGSLRFICLATLLLQPDLPSTILLDEPELGLHPYAITVLADLLRGAAVEKQVIVSTQSVTLVNQFDLEDIIVVERIDGASVFRQLDRAAMESWLEEYGLGDLWEKNVLGGRP